MRKSNPSDPKGPFLYSSPIAMPKNGNTDFLFARGDRTPMRRPPSLGTRQVSPRIQKVSIAVQVTQNPDAESGGKGEEGTDR